MDADPIKYLVHQTLRGVKDLVRNELREQPRVLERLLTAIDRYNEDLVAAYQAAARDVDGSSERSRTAVPNDPKA